LRESSLKSLVQVYRAVERLGDAVQDG